MLQIIKSLSILCIVSLLVATICNHFFALSFQGVFILCAVVQLALGWFFNTYIQYKSTSQWTQQQTELITQLEQEATMAPCAYCGTENLIPVSPTQDNDFECVNCGEHNAVYVNITVAQKIVPLDVEPYSVSNHNTSLGNQSSTKQADKE